MLRVDVQPAAQCDGAGVLRLVRITRQAGIRGMGGHRARRAAIPAPSNVTCSSRGRNPGRTWSPRKGPQGFRRHVRHLGSRDSAHRVPVGGCRPSLLCPAAGARGAGSPFQRGSVDGVNHGPVTGGPGWMWSHVCRSSWSRGRCSGPAGDGRRRAGVERGCRRFSITLLPWHLGACPNRHTAALVQDVGVPPLRRRRVPTVSCWSADSVRAWLLRGSDGFCTGRAADSGG